MQYTFYQYIYFFFFYSFIGWIFEEIVMAFHYGKFINRGFVNGPFCVKYGAVMTILIADFSDLMQYPLIQFIVSFVVIVVMQYLAGVLVSRIAGRRLWDYSNERFNLNGYVNFKYTFGWSVLAMALIWLVHPFLYMLYELVPQLPMKIVLWITVVVFLIDMFVTAASVQKWDLQGNIYDSVADRLGKTKQKLGTRLFKGIQRRIYKAFPEMEQQQKTEKDGFGRPENRVFAQGLCFDKLVWIFFISALVGDWIETVFVWATTGVIMSRSSVLYGTFSIVWGLGGAIITGLLYTLRKKSNIYIFIAGFFMGGVYEYSCSVFTELVFKTTFWDYSHMPFNINGRINLLFCFFWGALAIVWLKLLYPAVSKLIEKIPPVAGVVVTWLIIVSMTLNMLISGVAIARFVSRRDGVEAKTHIEQFLDHSYSDAFIQKIYPNMKITD